MFGFWLLWVKVFLSHITVLERETSVNEEYKMNKYIVEKCSSLEKRSHVLTVVKPLLQQNDR